MQKTVFVSSTYRDLKAERKAVWDVVKNFDALVRGMEQFGARDETPLQTCLIELEQSDIYVGILGVRLGSIDTGSGKSFTQLEYERAAELSKPILIYLIDEENAVVPIRNFDDGEYREKLKVFKKRLRETHTVETFLDATDLAGKLDRDLRRHLTASVDSPLPTDEVATSRLVLTQFRVMPMTVVGKEILLHMLIRGEPYAASRAVCDAFQMNFGATLGIPIDLAEPTDVPVELSDVFADAKLAHDLLSLHKGDQLQAYVRLHFSAKPLDNLRARYATTYKPLINIGLAGSMRKEIEGAADSSLAGQISTVLHVSKALSDEPKSLPSAKP